MSKTLEARLKLENAEARKKAKEVGEAAADGMNKAAEAAERTAAATDRMADNTRKAAENSAKAATSAETSAKALSRFALSMGGMLLGAGANALAATMPESGARQALSIGGKVLGGASQGAAMGAPLGPWGMGIGAVLGAGAAGVNMYADSQKEERAKQEAIEKTNAANREFYNSMLAAQARTEAFRATIDSLGDGEKTLAERQAEVAAEIEKRTKMEDRLKAEMLANSGKGADTVAQQRFARQAREYATNHGELEQLKRMHQALGAETQTEKGAERTGYGAADALSRLDGSFAGAGYLSDRAQRTFDEQLSVLKSIDSKTKTGGATWQ